MKQENDCAWAHALARFGLGINIALHGLTRLPDLRGFASGLQDQFAKSVLPASLVFAGGYGIVIAEAVTGILLVLGLFLRPTLVAGIANVRRLNAPNKKPENFRSPAQLGAQIFAYEQPRLSPQFKHL